MKKILNNKNIICILLLVLLISVAYWPLLKNINQTIVGWGKYYIMTLLLSQSVHDYHQFPFRTHLFESGYPFIGDIENWGLSPFGLLIYLFGGVVGVRIVVFSYILIGTLGMFYLARSILNYNYIGSIFSSALFILSPWLAYRIIDSDFYYLCNCFIPLFFAFFIKSTKGYKYLILAAIILSLYISIGGLTSLIAVLFILVFSILAFFDYKENKIRMNKGWIINFVILIVFALLLSSAKLIPMASLIKTRSSPYFHTSPKVEQQYGIIKYDENGNVTETLSQRCFNMDKLQKALFKSDFPECYTLSIYFGYIPIIIFFVSLAFYFKKLIRYFLLLLFFTLLMFGPNSPIDIYKPLWSINNFTHALHKPDKYFLPYIIFFIALISGQGFSLITRFKGYKKYIYTGIACLLVAFSIYDVFKVHHSIMNQMKYTAPSNMQKKSNNDNFFQVEFYKPPDEIHRLNIIQNDDFWFYPLFQQNIGIVNYYPAVSITSSAIPKYFISAERSQLVFDHIDRFSEIEHLFAVNQQYKGEVFFLTEKNKASLIYFSPDKIIIDAAITIPDKLIINQNYHNAWSSNKGRIINYKGLLAVELSKKDSGLVELNYLPFDFILGLIITSITVAGLFLFSLYFRRSKR